MMSLGTLDMHCDTGKRNFKYKLCDPIVENIKRYGMLSVFYSYQYEQVNVHSSQEYKEFRRRNV